MFDFADLLRSLWAQKGRAVSTLLGIVWGTMAIVLLLAFGFGLERRLTERREAMGQSIVIAWPTSTTKPFAGLEAGRPVRVTAGDVLALGAQIPGIDRCSPEFSSRTTLQVGEAIHQVRLAGVHPDFEQLRRMVPEPGGRFLNARDLAEARRVVFLGDRVARALFGRRAQVVATDAVGATVMLRGVPFLVVGVMRPKDQDNDYNGLDENRVCIPTSTYTQLFGNRYVSNFVFHARDPAELPAIKRRVYEILGRRKQFDPTDEQAMWIWDTTEQERMMFFVFLGLHVVLGLSGVLTLVVGGIGVGNLMFIMVRQRTAEIGLQMALGARPRQVLAGVLGEALILVGAGGAIGFGLSWLVCALTIGSGLTVALGEPVISPAVVTMAVTVLGGIGLLAGYFPARRAARVDPVRALTEVF